MRRKENFASAFGIQNKNWGGGGGGNHAFFRDSKASMQWKKRHILFFSSTNSNSSKTKFTQTSANEISNPKEKTFRVSHFA